MALPEGDILTFTASIRTIFTKEHFPIIKEFWGTKEEVKKYFFEEFFSDLHGDLHCSLSCVFEIRDEKSYCTEESCKSHTGFQKTDDLCDLCQIKWDCWNRLFNESNREGVDISKCSKTWIVILIE